MKAMQLTKIGPIENGCLELVDIPVPQPKDNEILVKVSVCGACHTDLDEAEGRLEVPRLPVVPGHQVVGTVAEKGKEAQRGLVIGYHKLYMTKEEKEGFMKEISELLMKYETEDLNKETYTMIQTIARIE